MPDGFHGDKDECTLITRTLNPEERT